MRASHVRAAWRKLQEAPNPSSIVPPLVFSHASIIGSYHDCLHHYSDDLECLVASSAHKMILWHNTAGYQLQWDKHAHFNTLSCIPLTGFN
jgi:hypothetical protein